MPVMSMPRLSVTVALTVAVDPVDRRNDVCDCGLPNTSREMDCTGQVVNCSGWDVTPPTVAKIVETPGIAAVASS
jgi:hypothetical protein